jgi:hypothetical protein
MIAKSILTGKSIVIDFNDEARRLRRLQIEHLARLEVNGLKKKRTEIYVTWEENQR